MYFQNWKMDIVERALLSSLPRPFSSVAQPQFLFQLQARTKALGSPMESFFLKRFEL